jgi:hypothetical protein
LWDISDTNFGGAARRGTNNVFVRQKANNLKMSTGCDAHILHNALQTSADILPIDLKPIVYTILYYFHIYIYMVQVEELKVFCDFIDAEYKQVLGSV